MAKATVETAEPQWLSERRREGASLARELELPTHKAKGWEFTDLSDLDLDSFTDAAAVVDGLEPADEEGAPLVLPLAEAVAGHADLVSQHLGRLVDTDDPFVARNEERWRHGLLVYVPPGTRLDEPLDLRIEAPEGEALHWRTLIVVGDGAEADVWERYGSSGDGLFNGVVELIVGDGATLRYGCEQELSNSSWAFATQRAEIGRDASLDWTALGFGSARGKVRMETKLAGPGSSARVTGAYAGNGTQHLDYDTTQEHAADHTTSDLAFRGVLTDRATSVWRGMIRVDKGAQQTDAFQENRNLLLSKEAHADAIPGLEIEADDVRCTHAAAVAQLDPDQLFYLRSRGLGDEAAQRLVVEGFVGDLLARAPEGLPRERLSDALERRLGELLGS